MTTTRQGFRDLTANLISRLGQETLAKTTQELSAKAQVSVDIIIRNLFERTADIGFLATDDDIREFIRNAQAYKTQQTNNDEQDIQPAKEKYNKNLEKLLNRFQEYVAKYSVYHNIILLDPEGHVLAQLDKNNPVEFSTDLLIHEALKTSEDYVETYRHSDLLPNEDNSLIYSYRFT